MTFSMTDRQAEEMQTQIDRKRASLEISEGRLDRPDFHPIGASASRAVSTPQGLGSIHPRPPPASPTGGTQRQELTPSSSIGRQLSVLGAEGRETIQGAIRSRDSDQIESALYRSLKRELMSSLQSVAGPDYELVGYNLIGPIDAVSLAALLRMAEEITKPGGEAIVIESAMRCLTVTKSREADALDLRAMIAIFADDLAEFPEDVVRTAFRKWARREKWWPSLSEIREECHRATRWRHSLRLALEGHAR